MACCLAATMDNGFDKHYLPHKEYRQVDSMETWTGSINNADGNLAER
jgi:hypothetical protein